MKMTIPEFAERVSIECEGLPALIAKRAIDEKEIDDLMEIFREHFDRNPEILNKMLGEELFTLFKEIK
jgi:hypothetical protein